MKNYNYFYYGKAIQKLNFINNVPENWKDEIDEFGEFSFGGYRAVLID